MKFSKVGQVFLALVVSLGLTMGVTSCSNSYTVGFLYVTASQRNQISGFKINNETGFLRPIDKTPVGSGGANPIKEIILSGGRFLYVLNQGTFTYNSDGTSTGTASNISLFQIGGNGVLTFQASYASQGNNSISLLSDAGGTHMYILDQYSTASSAAIPSSASPTTSSPCLNSTDGRYYPVGDVSAYTIDPNTGRLALITNQQVASPDGKGQLTFFPIGCSPTEFKLVGGYIFTIQQGSPANAAYPVADLQTVFTYAQSASNGQLTLTQNAPLQTNAAHLTYINSDPAGKYIYLLDAGPVNCVSSVSGVTSTTQIMPYTIGTGGILASLVGGNVCNDPTATNPNLLITDSKTKFLYVANAGPNNGQNSPASEITAFNIDPAHGTLNFITGQPFPTGSGPRCLIEDPSNQFIYTANFNDSTVVGSIINTNNGTLTQLRRGTSFATSGNPTWCVASGVTQ